MASAPCSICGSTEGPDHICPGQNAQLVGQTLNGKYVIEEILGQGGMGMVFRATNVDLQQKVAVKTLHPSLAAAPQFFERFRREAQLAANLKHPNLIAVVDFGRADSGAAAGTCFYVMELLNGQSLKQLVKGSGPMSLRRAADIIEQCARGLSHAHAKNAVHRDIKPHNIMVEDVDGHDHVKILDFGLVKAMEQEEGEQLTSTGQVLGTPQYMPPEQAGGEAVDQRSDLYSLAGVFYYCLTGTSPFGANTVRKALQAALTQTVASVNTKRDGAPIPRELDEFFRKALAREKEDRHQNCDDFIDDFRNALANCTDAELDARPNGVIPEVKEGGSGSGVRRKGSSPSSRTPSSVRNRTPSSVGSRPSSRSAPSVKQPSNVIVDRGAMTLSRPKGEAAQMPPAAARPPPSSAGSEGLSTGVKVALVLGPMLLLGAGAGIVMKMKSDATPQPVAVVEPAQKPMKLNPTPKADPVVAKQDPVEAPVAGPVVVTIKSSPDGAEVYEGESLVGVTPLELRLSREPHALTLKRDGFSDLSKPLDLSRFNGDSMDLPLTLKAVAKADTGKSGGSVGAKSKTDKPDKTKAGGDMATFE